MIQDRLYLFPRAGVWGDGTPLSLAINGPLSGANGALPWIIFQRDEQVFTLKFPNLKIKKIQPLMPFVYIFSGGVSLRSLCPGFTYPIIRLVERLLPRNLFSMFAFIIIEKIENSPESISGQGHQSIN